MSDHYQIDGYEVVYTPWHSEYLDKDFVAVYVFKEGREVLHAGMTHAKPSEDDARRQVELVKCFGEVRDE